MNKYINSIYIVYIVYMQYQVNKKNINSIEQYTVIEIHKKDDGTLYQNISKST
jgi:hypothetical protein